MLESRALKGDFTSILSRVSGKIYGKILLLNTILLVLYILAILGAFGLFKLVSGSDLGQYLETKALEFAMSYMVSKEIPWGWMVSVYVVFLSAVFVVLSYVWNYYMLVAKEEIVGPKESVWKQMKMAFNKRVWGLFGLHWFSFIIYTVFLVALLFVNVEVTEHIIKDLYTQGLTENVDLYKQYLELANYILMFFMLSFFLKFSAAISAISIGGYKLPHAIAFSWQNVRYSRAIVATVAIILLNLVFAGIVFVYKSVVEALMKDFPDFDPLIVLIVMIVLSLLYLSFTASLYSSGVGAMYYRYSSELDEPEAEDHLLDIEEEQ